jgi:hypothetical protein
LIDDLLLLLRLLRGAEAANAEPARGLLLRRLTERAPSGLQEAVGLLLLRLSKPACIEQTLRLLRCSSLLLRLSKAAREGLRLLRRTGGWSTETEAAKPTRGRLLLLRGLAEASRRLERIAGGSEKILLCRLLLSCGRRAEARSERRSLRGSLLLRGSTKAAERRRRIAERLLLWLLAESSRSESCLLLLLCIGISSAERKATRGRSCTEGRGSSLLLRRCAKATEGRSWRGAECSGTEAAKASHGCGLAVLGLLLLSVARSNSQNERARERRREGLEREANEKLNDTMSAASVLSPLVFCAALVSSGAPALLLLLWRQKSTVLC